MAWYNDQVIAVVFAFIRQGVGIVSQVAVRKAWQRRGVGRALLTESLNKLHDRGLTQARLFTNAANEHGARGLYESLGFREVKQHIFYRKPLD